MNDVFQVVRQNEMDIYSTLIDTVDIDTTNGYGHNLLIEAISHNNTFLGSDLIKRGIDVNHQDNNGQTPLHFAAMFGQLLLAEAIIHAGGNPNIKDSQQNNALWTAAINARGNYKVAELFKRAGGDAFSKNKANRSAVDFAKQIGDEILLAILEM